jgi:hypothetical protein
MRRQTTPEKPTPPPPKDGDRTAEICVLAGIFQEGKPAMERALATGLCSLDFACGFGEWFDLCKQAYERGQEADYGDALVTMLPPGVERLAHLEEIDRIKSFSLGFHSVQHYAAIVHSLAARKTLAAYLSDAKRTLENGETTIEDWVENEMPKIIHFAAAAKSDIHDEAPELWTPSQFMAYDKSKEAPLLAGGILARGRISSFLGAGGIGKSRMTLDLAAALVAGRKWCGLPVHEEGIETLILCTENSPGRWQADFQRLMNGASAQDKSLIDKRIMCLALPPGKFANLQLQSEGLRLFKLYLRRRKWGLVVLDPWSDFSAADSENDNAQMLESLRTVQHCLAECAPTAACLIVHHARTGREAIAQAGDRFQMGGFGRGAKALYSKVRAEIQVAPDEDDTLVVCCGKANDAERFAPRAVKLHEETGQYCVIEGWNEDDWRARVTGKKRTSEESGPDIADVIRRLQQGVGASVERKKIISELTKSGTMSPRKADQLIKQALLAERITNPKFGYYAI